MAHIAPAACEAAAKEIQSWSSIPQNCTSNGSTGPAAQSSGDRKKIIAACSAARGVPDALVRIRDLGIIFTSNSRSLSALAPVCRVTGQVDSVPIRCSGNGFHQDLGPPLTTLCLIFSQEEGFCFSRIQNPKRFSRSSPHHLTFRPFAGLYLGRSHTNSNGTRESAFHR